MTHTVRVSELFHPLGYFTGPFLHKIKGFSFENCLTKEITGLSLSEFETVLANFATNSVVSIYVFLANNAPGRWPDQNMENIRKK